MCNHPKTEAAKPHPFAGKTWREVANSMPWPEFREAILDSDCLQIVNTPWWREQYLKLREDSGEKP